MSDEFQSTHETTNIDITLCDGGKCPACGEQVLDVFKGEQPHAPDCIIAALRAQLESEQAVNREHVQQARRLIVERDEANAEVERLRAALRDISAIGKTPGNFDTTDAIAAVVIANAALRNGE